jgi:hypothetical protein
MQWPRATSPLGARKEREAAIEARPAPDDSMGGLADA